MPPTRRRALLSAALLSLARPAAAQPAYAKAADWRWNRESYVDKSGAPKATDGRTSLVPFGMWGSMRQGWQLARSAMPWYGGLYSTPSYAAQGTMMLMKHVAEKKDALAAPAPHPFYGDAFFGTGADEAPAKAPLPPFESGQGLERQPTARPRRGRKHKAKR